jgi:hypothetical protein
MYMCILIKVKDAEQSHKVCYHNLCMIVFKKDILKHFYLGTEDF